MVLGVDEEGLLLADGADGEAFHLCETPCVVEGGVDARDALWGLRMAAGGEVEHHLGGVDEADGVRVGFEGLGGGAHVVVATDIDAGRDGDGWRVDVHLHRGHCCN